MNLMPPEFFNDHKNKNDFNGIAMLTHRILPVFSATRFVMILLTLIMTAGVLFASPALADTGGDAAGKNVFFKEEVEPLVRVPEKSRIVPPSVRPYPEAGKVAYVVEDPNGFKVCMDNACGPYVSAVARGMPVVSPDGNHWAAVVQKDGKHCVMLNGGMGRSYDRVAALRFSPDAMKVAYIAQEGDGFFVCVNQDRHRSFSLIDPEQGLVFSSDSKQLAYVARVDKNAWCVVKNGEPGPIWEEVKLLAFSPDGSRLAYTARQNDQWHVVEGDSKSPGYKTVLRVTFSPDSKSLGYIARSKEGAFVVLNGQKQAVYEAVMGELIFSSNSQRLAYSVLEKTVLGKNRMRMVLDGKIGEPYDFIGAYLFSIDGKQFAYAAHKGVGQQLIVHGNVEHEIYDAVGIPMFDLTGRHLAYQAKKGENWHIIHDRQAGPAFDMATLPAFSLQGDRLGYIAAKEGVYVVVVDGRVLGKYQWAGDLAFSPDGKHVVYGAAERSDDAGNLKSFIVIDGRKGEQRFFSFLKETPLVFMDNFTVQGIVLGEEGMEFSLVRAIIDKEKP